MAGERTVSILVADDEEGIRYMFSQLLGKDGYTVHLATDGDEAVAMAEREDHDVIVLDVKMPRMNGLDAWARIRQIRPNTPVVLITAHGSEEVGREAVAAGAYDYFTKPLDIMELRIVVKRALERRNLLRQIEARQQQEQLLREKLETAERERASLKARLMETRQLGKMIGSSAAMLDVFSLIQRVGPRDVTILILGESGTGKELVAQAIVDNSPRRTTPFIKVNCAAIPETLLESELFGHERGAFTGAILTKPGKFELADKGTIFLDEIGDLSASLQAKLLRVLQEREFERVGGTRSIKVDLRIITATNCDLPRKVAEGRFREDLYFRLNVIPITLPPLRNRVEDLPLLVDQFVGHFSEQFGKNISGVSPDVMELFVSYSWPGNVRELENVIQRACILTQEPRITVQSLPPEMRRDRASGLETPAGGDASRLIPAALFDDFSTPLAKKMETLTAKTERDLIVRALEKCSGRRQAAADLLGISRKSLHNKMVKYGLLNEKTGNEGDGNV